jgi:hypothetical protein
MTEKKPKITPIEKRNLMHLDEIIQKLNLKVLTEPGDFLVIPVK